MASSNPWPSNDNFNVCSQGVCSVYCPQYCYFFFKSPPPSSTLSKDSVFSPLIIALIGILVCAFIVLTYYTFIRRYIRRRDGVNRDGIQEGHRGIEGNHWRIGGGGGGLDEDFIRRITVCRYRKGDGSIDGTECAVCLGEFQQNQALRVLPKCNHAFHVPCIDTWLKSHPNCPICRGNVSAGAPPEEPREVVLVIEDREEAQSNSNEAPKSPINRGFGRSLSLGVRKNQWNFAGEERTEQSETQLMKRCNSTGFMVAIIY